MNRKTVLTLGAAAIAAAIGAVAIPAIAEGWGRHDQMMRMMHGDEARITGDHRGPGMGMRRGGQGSMTMGPMGMGRMTENPVYRSFDADGDGTVSAAELDTGTAALHVEHDADGNGALSSDEFAALFAEVTRSMADRPFTILDADEDGEISAEEMALPARMMAFRQRMHGDGPGADTDTDADTNQQ